MKKLAIDKTDKKEVEYYRNKMNKYKNKPVGLIKEVFKGIKINSSSNFEQDYECWECGKKIRYYDEPNERVFCYKCRLNHSKEISKISKEITLLKSKIMLENAMVIIENSNSYSNDYRSSYEYMKKYIEMNPTSYKSSEEVVVAIILTEYNYEFKENYKVDKYIVDFYIPEEKICLEVDGDRHKYNRTYDKNRDIRIREKLGEEWEVVRIPTTFIEINPSKIPDAMMKLKEEIQSERKKYGIINDNFSKREQEYYGSILGLKQYRTEKEEYNKQYNTIKKYFETKKN